MSSQRHATVVGLGSVLPERIVSNEWFESFIDTSDEWIRERTGIRERHYALDGQTTSDLATDATRRALETAAIAMSRDEIQNLIYQEIAITRSHEVLLLLSNKLRDLESTVVSLSDKYWADNLNTFVLR